MASIRSTPKAAARRRISVESADGIDNSDNNCNRISSPSHFPYKLYDMLEYAADSEFFYAVSWSEDGKSFAIHDKDEFMMHVVPMFFKQTKFRSFTRQLNLWGFTRLTRCGLWSHEDFIRGNTERLDRIQRVEIKSTVAAATDGKSKPKKKATQQRKSARPTRTSSRRVLAASPDNSLHTVDESLPTPQEAVVSPSPQNEAANVMGIPAAMPMPLLSRMVLPAASSSNYATANASSQQVSYPVVSFTNSVDDSQSYQGYPSSPIQYQQQTTNNLGHSMVNSGYQPRMPLQRRGITSPLSNHTVKQQQYTDQQQQLPPSNVTTTSDNNDNSTTNEDLMFLLSGIFEAEVNGPSSTDDNDLCSFLSLIDMSDDFMEPISFY